MARKSRKNKVVEAKPVKKMKTYNAAAYLRLSSDDRRKKGDSLAIQKSIIQQFIERNPQISLHEIYSDNAKSGTSFDRPAFKRMIEDIEKGAINCVIVKDLSRFGRNAIDAGYYIERYMPSYGVRFIAIADDYDSDDANSNIMLPLKNIVNEAYAADIGRKCRAVKKQNMDDGKFIGRYAPYGYLKSPDNCHKLIIDKKAGHVVQQIFAWAKEGARPNEIVRRLNDSKILPPSAYRQANGILDDNSLVACYWSRMTVYELLANKVYIGDMVQGKTRMVDYKEVQVPPSEWITVENTHEAIISRELYYEVQEVIKQNNQEIMEIRSPKVPFSPNIFKGKIFCGHCGYAMHRHRQNKDGVYWFRCHTQHKYSESACVQVSVKEEDLKAGAALMLRNYAEALLGHKVKLCKKAHEKAPEKHDRDKEYAGIQRDIEKNHDYLKVIFDQLVRGEISTADFTEKKSVYESKMSVLAQQTIDLETSEKHIEKSVRECWKLADCVMSINCKYDLTVELLDSLIEKILIWHDKSYEIVWRFSEPFEESRNELWAM